MTDADIQQPTTTVMLGRYRLVKQVGRGGMGEVWLAEDTELRRQIAVKLLPAVLASDQSYLHAFEYEARAAAALEHPHILPVHDFGDQRLADNEVATYLIMPYISGGSLRDLMRSSQHPQPVDKSITYLRQAALAIDYAHSMRVLHRDIKPANMLLQDEWLFIADFGIAKLLSSSAHQTKTHAGAGTPEYMAPEQAQGHAEPASDRYSLAMTAYQLFTGALPFRGETPYAVLIKQMTEVPTSPRLLNPLLPESIEAILLQGLAKQPGDRPASCVAFVDALEQAWQTMEPQDDPEATVLAPWSKRMRKVVLFPESPATVPQSVTQNTPVSQPPILSGPQAQLPAWQNPVSQPNTGPTFNSTAPVPPHYAQTMLQNVEQGPNGLPLLPPQQAQKRKVSRRELLIGGGAAATIAVVGGASFLAWKSLTPSKPPVDTKPAPGPKKLIPGIPLANMTGHSRTVHNVMWDSTGRYLATTSEDQTVMVWDVGTIIQGKSNAPKTLSKPLRRWKFSSTVYSNRIAWSRDGRMLIVTTGDDNKVYLLDVFGKNQEPIIYLNMQYANNFDAPTYTNVAASPTSNLFATSTLWKQRIELWQVNQRDKPIKSLTDTREPLTIQGATIEIEGIAWSADGSLLAGSTNNFGVMAWDIKTGTVKYAMNLPTPQDLNTKSKTVYTLRNAIQWSPTSTQYILVSNADTAAIWDVRQGSKPYIQLGTDDPPAITPPKNKNTGFGVQWSPNVTGLSWSPNGRYIIGGYGRSRRLYIWDLQAKSPKTNKDGTHMQDLIFGDTDGHSDTIVDVRWSPNGRYVASSSFDTTVIVWKVDGA